MFGARHWLLGCVLVLLSGCEREAPGPRECVRLAEAALGVREEEVLRSPRMKQAFDELVVKCLTTPYDRELVECVEAGRRARQCLSEFVVRRSDEGTRSLPW